MTEWRDLSIAKQIAVVSARHPYPMRALIFIVMTIATDAPWGEIFKVAERMGYIEMTHEEDLGGGMSRIHKEWAVP